MNSINTIAKSDIIKAAIQKYNSYDSEWEKAYFDELSGGYNVYHINHNFSKKGGGGDAEITVGKILAKYNGKQVEFLPEGGKKSPDVKFDNKTWDIKLIDNANETTIRNNIKDARKAENVIFYWDYSIEKLEYLRSAIIREVGRHRKYNRTHEIPNIYYIEKNGLLMLLWEKQKGLNK